MHVHDPRRCVGTVCGRAPKPVRVYVSPFASNWTDTVTSNSNGTSTIMTYTVWGLLITTTAGALHFQWAQNTSNATNTHIKAQSFLCAQRIG